MAVLARERGLRECAQSRSEPRSHLLRRHPLRPPAIGNIDESYSSCAFLSTATSFFPPCLYSFSVSLNYSPNRNLMSYSHPCVSCAWNSLNRPSVFLPSPLAYLHRPFLFVHLPSFPACMPAWLYLSPRPCCIPLLLCCFYASSAFSSVLLPLLPLPPLLAFPRVLVSPDCTASHRAGLCLPSLPACIRRKLPPIACSALDRRQSPAMQASMRPVPPVPPWSVECLPAHRSAAV